jgi:hypothetical protein
MAFNLGYKHRKPWVFNWRLMCFLFIFLFIQFFITLYPSKLSCLFRINCINQDAVRVWHRSPEVICHHTAGL